MKKGSRYPKTPRCPICGKLATTTETRYGLRHSCCGLWSWDRSPLQPKEVHEARIRAHDAFDRIWKSGLMTRTEAYKELSERTGIPKKRCHIKQMGIDGCNKVIEATRKMI